MHVVTGAFGFTGNFITRRLLAMGACVRTLTRNPGRPNPFGSQVSVAAYNFDNAEELANRFAQAERGIFDDQPTEGGETAA